MTCPLVACAAAFVVAGCDDAPRLDASPPRSECEAPAGGTPPGASTSDTRVATEVFAVAHAKKVRARVPARFRAALPAALAELDAHPERYPPPSFVTMRLCDADPGMQGRFLDGFRRALGRRDPDNLTRYRGLLGECDGAAKCDWLATVVTRRGPLALRRALWPALAVCRDRRYAPVVAHHEAPSAALVGWIVDQPETVPRELLRLSDSRLVAALAQFARSGPEHNARTAGNAVRMLGDKGSVKLVKAAQARIPDERRRHLLALSLFGLDDDEAVELVDAACAGLAESEEREAVCERHAADGADGDRGEADGGTAVGDDDESGDDDPDNDPAPAARALKPIRPTLASMLAALRQAGLIEEREAPAPPPGWPYSAADLLVALRRAFRFYTGSISDPPAYDMLAHNLAHLVSPRLDDVVFEIAPVGVEPEAYGLRAYMDGFRYEISPAPDEERGGADTLAALLNRLLFDRASALRLASLADEDGLALVVAGTEAALRASRARRLLAFRVPTPSVEGDPAPPHDAE